MSAPQERAPGRQMIIRVYLAGPEVFLPNAREIRARKARHLRAARAHWCLPRRSRGCPSPSCMKLGISMEWTAPLRLLRRADGWLGLLVVAHVARIRFGQMMVGPVSANSRLRRRVIPP